MEEHSKFRQYHWKALSAAGTAVLILTACGVVMNGCEGDRVRRVRSEPVHARYSIVEDAYKDLVTKQQELYSATQDPETRRAFSELVDLASNNFARSELAEPEDVKRDLEVKMNDKLFDAKGKFFLYALGLGGLSTIALGGTYLLTMAGDYIYRKRRDKKASLSAQSNKDKK